MADTTQAASGGMNQELTRLRIDKTRKRPKRGGLGKILVFLLVLGAVAAGYFYYQSANAAVEVKTVKPQVVEATEAGAAAGAAVLTASGYVIPREVIEVSSKIIGRVRDMNVERGQQVKKGDILIKIEDDQEQAQLRMAQSRLAAVNARLAEMRAGSRPQEIRAARADVASAEATLENARLDYERKSKLTDVISQQEIDAARAAFGVAEASLNSARENLKLIETWPRKEMIDAAVAEQREAEANVAFAQTQVDNTVITAPVDGTILEKVAEVGELVTNANYGGSRGPQSAVVSMADLTDLQVELDINEDDLSRVRMRQPAEIIVDSAPGKTFKGEVDEMAPQADRLKGTVEVKVRLIDPTPDVLPEVNARVTFLEPAKAQQATTATEQARPRVFVPKTAVVGNGDDARVFIVAGGKAVEREIKVAAETPRGLEVTEGLLGSELLIAQPTPQILDGTKVKTLP